VHEPEEPETDDQEHQSLKEFKARDQDDAGVMGFCYDHAVFILGADGVFYRNYGPKGLRQSKSPRKLDTRRKGAHAIIRRVYPAVSPAKAMSPEVRIGCAGWSIATVHGELFPTVGSHIERYGRIFASTEINSCFYRSHRDITYERWANSVPGNFQFAVKLSKQITHETRLTNTRLLKPFMSEVQGLGKKLGPLLVQLPPSLAFDSRVAARFLSVLRKGFQGYVVCEPRHESWFAPAAERLFVRHRIARVAADPAVIPVAAVPGGWDGLIYYRLHGSPRKYFSSYSDKYLHNLAQTLYQKAAQGVPVWCIFDNTTLGAATPNAFALLQDLRGLSSNKNAVRAKTTKQGQGR
jgi:uncharacterized protein YecE (DUF72 family)